MSEAPCECTLACGPYASLISRILYMLLKPTWHPRKSVGTLQSSVRYALCTLCCPPKHGRPIFLIITHVLNSDKHCFTTSNDMDTVIECQRVDMSTDRLTFAATSIHRNDSITCNRHACMFAIKTLHDQNLPYTVTHVYTNQPTPNTEEKRYENSMYCHYSTLRL